ncbi:hypothetical protein M8997_011445 [Phyllobacterium sp. 21LDTY02-6]|uniref:hypothetical protein n=1 Tax=Phyllobacterium sp. 21LDTY02-6 TaxID=2944903 RepID=UPI00202184F5|nr:hypothetical protein [Phyllobacterium sp. 21LDTY02-6]MCO4317798.1 hypothetical protein [Phyllobacterium sp. 21LDTY02-6]
MQRKSDYLDDDLLQQRGYKRAAGSVLRCALLFGSAAVALALIIAPLAHRTSDALVDVSAGQSIDQISTGSIKRAEPSISTIRRSVLQNTPTAVCILERDGTRSGDC